MSEFKVRTKYNVGDEVWIVKEAAYNEVIPKVFVATVSGIDCILADDGEETFEPVVSYTLSFKGVYHIKDKFYDFQLHTEKEAKEIFKTLTERTQTFKDEGIKEILKRAKKFVEVYGK